MKKQLSTAVLILSSLSIAQRPAMLAGELRPNSLTSSASPVPVVAVKKVEPEAFKTASLILVPMVGPIASPILLPTLSPVVPPINPATSPVKPGIIIFPTAPIIFPTAPLSPP